MRASPRRRQEAVGPDNPRALLIQQVAEWFEKLGMSEYSRRTGATT
jgi:hypothetical protein